MNGVHPEGTRRKVKGNTGEQCGREKGNTIALGALGREEREKNRIQQKILTHTHTHTYIHTQRDAHAHANTL